MKIVIRNRKDYKGPGQWVCRLRSPLGNPFVLHDEKDRIEVIKKYKEWFYKQIDEDNQVVIQELDRLYELGKTSEELNLICWCFPKPCHSEIIANYLYERELKED